jgi:hypothetical protein
MPMNDKRIPGPSTASCETVASETPRETAWSRSVPLVSTAIRSRIENIVIAADAST